MCRAAPDGMPGPSSTRGPWPLFSRCHGPLEAGLLQFAHLPGGLRKISGRHRDVPSGSALVSDPGLAHL